jgi:ankyrin repeat protein
MIQLAIPIVACVVCTSVSCAGPEALPPPPPSRVWDLTPNPALQRANLQAQLMYAVCNGDAAGVRELLAAGADVNAPDRVGRSALAEAVSAGKAEVADVLLAAGARADRDLLAAAITRGHTPAALVGRLIDAGADVTWRDADGRTALYLATLANDRAVAVVLLDRGAAVDAIAKSGRTPLHAVAEADAAQVVPLLLDRGANVNARDGSLATPLHLAAVHGSWQVARLLLARGAAVDLRDAAGKTPADLARENDQPAVARVLAESRTREQLSKPSEQ